MNIEYALLIVQERDSRERCRGERKKGDRALVPRRDRGMEEQRSPLDLRVNFNLLCQSLLAGFA